MTQFFNASDGFSSLEENMPDNNDKDTEITLNQNETVDILGLCAGTVGYRTNNESENQRNTLLDNNLASNGEEGTNAQITDDKIPLVHDMKVHNSPFLAIFKTKMEFLRIFGVLVAFIISIVLIDAICEVRTKGKYPEMQNKFAHSGYTNICSSYSRTMP